MQKRVKSSCDLKIIYLYLRCLTKRITSFKKSYMKKCLAEMIGTMVLILMGCGVAVSLNCSSNCADVANAGTVIGTAMASGLSVVAMAYTIGGISSCHINPAITLGVYLSGRMNAKDCGMYMLFQVIGAIIGSAILYVLTMNARSIGPALFQGGTALVNLWIFIVGPFVGAACAAGIWKMIDPATK